MAESTARPIGSHPLSRASFMLKPSRQTCSAHQTNYGEQRDERAFSVALLTRIPKAGLPVSFFYLCQKDDHRRRIDSSVQHLRGVSKGIQRDIEAYRARQG